MLLGRIGRLVAVPSIAATLAVGLAVLAPGLSSPVSAESSPSCVTPVSGAPTGPATVSVASKAPFGRVLVIGAGPFTGCSLYLLTSDQLHALTFGLAPFACSDNPSVVAGNPCDSVLWPALLTKGAPVAGAGVEPSLLGTVDRSDILPGQSVDQVTYAGMPLYRFFLDETPAETDGANLFDPVTSPTGTWYLVNPRSGHPAPGRAQLQVEAVSGTHVLSASMDDDFPLLPGGSFPVYTLSKQDGRGRDCQGFCSLIWPPVLTSGRPEAGPGVDQDKLGVTVRQDGTRQVTYEGKPLYLFTRDAYIPTIIGMQGINGAGAVTPWGVFTTITLP
jgi:predicted lipoprotein with Yx(FWY)xxD motif